MDSGMVLPQLTAAGIGPERIFRYDSECYLPCKKGEIYEPLDLLGCTYSKHQVGMFLWAKIPPVTLTVMS